MWRIPWGLFLKYEADDGGGGGIGKNPSQNVINMMYVKSFNMKELRANDRIKVYSTTSFFAYMFFLLVTKRTFTWHLTE
mgnify:FL=1